MKTFKHIFTAFFSLLFVSAIAQVQLDHQLQMTGSGSNASITGIQQVTDSSAAVYARSLQQNSLLFAMATGSSNAYSVTLTPSIGSYTTGMIVHFIANFTNTGAATLSVNSLPSDTIKKNYNADLASGDIQNGQVVSVMYDGTHFQMLTQLGNTSTAAPHGKQLFTGNGTFYVPTSVAMVWVSMSGGGGGGGYGDNQYGAGGGGGAGAVMDSVLTLTQSSYLITVGSGGDGSTSTDGNGSDGDGSSFGSLLSVNGGEGAQGSSSPGIAGGPGGAAGGGGASSGYGYHAGMGGGSIFGGGGAGGVGTTETAGTGGSGYGGGGGGGCRGVVGGNGAPGFVLVEW